MIYIICFSNQNSHQNPSRHFEDFNYHLSFLMPSHLITNIKLSCLKKIKSNDEMNCAEININQNVWPFINKKNRSPPSQNILNIFLSQCHLIIARLNVMIADSNYLPSKSWSFEKEARFVNQSICIWWSHLSFTDKVCRQRRQRQFDDFFLTIFS